ncbi:MAG: nucleotidyltransferase family protein, partial [Halanaerobium sp.]|nr:nucleotidyltransferase family protein [Halanaerobium sp.]
MKALGIIAEYNPFHFGHLYQLEECRKKFPDKKIVCILSSNFVQRGEPAFVDKWTRAEMAISCGADLVIELPFAFSCRSAEYFAKGAIQLLDSLG